MTFMQHQIDYCTVFGHCRNKSCLRDSKPEAWLDVPLHVLCKATMVERRDNKSGRGSERK